MTVQRLNISWFVMCFGLLMLGTSVGAVFAQRPDTTLPDIAPKEFEILGDLEIVFPTLRRQPLTGFNPPPRIFQVPRGRRPYTDSYKQTTAEIPGTSLIRPATPPPTINVGQHPNTGELILGVGTYFSREIGAVAAFDLGRKARASIDLLHDGYDSFQPFDDEVRKEVEAPYKNFEGKLGLEYNLGPSVLGVDVSGFNEQFTLYGLRPSSSPSDSTADLSARPDRDGVGFGIAGSYVGGETSSFPVTLGVAFASDRYETTFDSLGLQTKESALDVDFSTRFDVGSGSLTFDGSLGTRSLDDDLTASTSVTGFDFGGDMQFELGGSSTLRLGAQVQGYSASDGHLPDSVELSKLYVAPRIEYRNNLAGGLEFYALNAPIVNQTSQRSIYEVNAFVVDRPTVMPELSIINLEGGLVYYAGPVRLSARGGWALHQSYLIFDPDSTNWAGSTFSGILYETSYGEVEAYRFGGDIAVAFPGSFSVALTADWQGATLDPDDDLPNFPSFIGGLRGTYTFPDDRAILQFDGKYIGSRPTDRTGRDELDGYLDLAALASYYVTPQIGIYGRAKTMTGNRFERWAGYPAADWIVMGGVRLRW